jgi:hypothetical protein
MKVPKFISGDKAEMHVALEALDLRFSSFLSQCLLKFENNFRI